MNTSFGFLKDIILNYSNVRSFDYPIEVQNQILQLMYIRWSSLNWESYNDLISKSTKNQDYSWSLTDAFCSYYDSHQKNIQSAHVPFELNDEVYLNILVIGNSNSWKSKFVSKYVGSKLNKLHEKSVSFTSNRKVIESSGCTAILNIIESPTLGKYKDQIVDQLKDVHVCIFVFETCSEGSFDTIKDFITANQNSIKNIEWVLWANSEEQRHDVDANIMKFTSKHSLVYYEFWFDDKAKIKTIFTETVDRYV